jgi:hypothetical protein
VGASLSNKFEKPYFGKVPKNTVLVDEKIIDKKIQKYFFFRFFRL